MCRGGSASKKRGRMWAKSMPFTGCTTQIQSTDLDFRELTW